MPRIRRIESIYHHVYNSFNIYKNIFYIILFLFFVVMAFFVVPATDASLYLHETVHIAETIKDFKWIGNEPVGTHGFIFKLIPAVLLTLFDVTPVLFILYNVVLSFLCVLLFEAIAKFLFKDNVLILCAIIIFSTTYFYIRCTLSYSREIPVLFSTLLFILRSTEEKESMVAWLFSSSDFRCKRTCFFTDCSRDNCI